jgi:hypothetical protein
MIPNFKQMSTPVYSGVRYILSLTNDMSGF